MLRKQHLVVSCLDSTLPMTTNSTNPSNSLLWVGKPKLERKERRATLAPQAWEDKRAVLDQRYRIENRPLKDVIQYMKENYDFDATKRQYERQFEKWGFSKRPVQRRQSQHHHSRASITSAQSSTPPPEVPQQIRSKESHQTSMSTATKLTTKEGYIVNCSPSSSSPVSPVSIRYGSTLNSSHICDRPTSRLTTSALSKADLQLHQPSMIDAEDYQQNAEYLANLGPTANIFDAEFDLADQEAAKELLLSHGWQHSCGSSPTTSTSTSSDGTNTTDSVSSYKAIPCGGEFSGSYQTQVPKEQGHGSSRTRINQITTLPRDKLLDVENEQLPTKFLRDQILDDNSIPHKADALPASTASDFTRKTSLATTNSCELVGSQQILPSLITELLQRGSADASQIEIPIDLLNIGNSSMAPIVLSAVALRARTNLEDMMAMMSYEVDAASISATDITKLVRTARFLFAAQGYEHCHALSSFTWRLMQDSSSSTQSLGFPSAWLEVAVNLIKSATTLRGLKLCADILDLTRSLQECSTSAVGQHLAVLYACLGEAIHRLSNDSEADIAAFECWTTSQTIAPMQEHTLTHTVLSAATQHIVQRFNHQPLPDAMDRQLNELLGAIGVPSQNCANLNKNMRLVLVWCVNALDQTGFTSMISNIDEKFWKTPTVPSEDVKVFERLVTYSYLCGCLWRHERLDRCKVTGGTDADVANAFKELYDRLGLTSEDVLAAVVQLLDTPDPAMQSTMSTRYHSRMDDICRQFILKAIGFQIGGRSLTPELLMSLYQWPGQWYYINSRQSGHQFYDIEYAANVGSFLREFASIGLQLAESEALQPILTCFHAGRAVSDEPLVPRTTRSSQMSDDLRDFRKAGKRRSNNSARSIPHSLQLPSAAFDDLLSENWSDDRIFRYSGSLKSRDSGSNMSISGTSLRSSNRISTSGSSARSSRVGWISRSSLARSIMEVDEG